MNLRQRRRRVELTMQRLRNQGCLACRERRGRTMLMATAPGSGWKEERPEPVSVCLIPEQIVLVSEVIVGAGAASDGF